MKKNIIYLVVGISMLSCKKDEAESSDSFNTFVVNKSAEANFGLGNTKDSILLDVDNDGSNDFQLNVENDTNIIYDTPAEYIHSYLTALGGTWTVATHLNSKEADFILTDTVVENSGSITTVNYVHERVCSNDYNWTYANLPFESVQIESDPELVLTDNYNWSIGSNTQLSFSRTHITEYTYNPSLNAYEGSRFVIEEQCHAVGEGETVFVPVRHVSNGQTRLGWIKLEIDGAKVTVFEVGIQI